MAAHDSIGDFLTILRNGYRAQKPSVVARFSNVREGIVRILKAEGYIESYRIYSEGAAHRFIEVNLKYVDGNPAIVGIERFSKPGRRLYSKHDVIPRVIGGLGVAILTTSRGILRDRDAKRMKVGGEVLCKVW